MEPGYLSSAAFFGWDVVTRSAAFFWMGRGYPFASAPIPIKALIIFDFPVSLLFLWLSVFGRMIHLLLVPFLNRVLIIDAYSAVLLKSDCMYHLLKFLTHYHDTQASDSYITNVLQFCDICVTSA